MNIASVFPRWVVRLLALGVCVLSSELRAAPADADAEIINGVRTNLILTATLNSNRIAASELLILKVVLQNNSTNKVQLSLVNKLHDCAVLVRDASGADVPTTRLFQKSARAASSMGDRVLVVAPSQSHTFELPVSRMFDLSYPERYYLSASVRVFVEVSNRVESFDLKSDVHELTVLRSAAD
jgi:hypothetical protein